MKSLFLFASGIAIGLALAVTVAADAIDYCSPEILRECTHENKIQETRYGDLKVTLAKVLACCLGKRGWYDTERWRWNKQRIVDDCGADTYNYCRFQFDRTEVDSYTSFQKILICINQAKAKIARVQRVLLGCAAELNATTEALNRYAEFPSVEAIPCLFKCFATKMNLYAAERDGKAGSENAVGEWLFDIWLETFGPVGNEQADRSMCRASLTQRQEQPLCAWMYDEYLCLERLYYNTNGSARFKKAAVQMR